MSTHREPNRGDRSENVTGRTSQRHATGDNPVDGVDNPPASAGHAHPPAGSDGASLDDSSLRGPDLARAALAAAKEQSKTKGRPRKRLNAGRGRRRRSWSGPGSDDRDPQPLGRLAARIAADRGWADKLAGGQVFARWSVLVGGEIAEHTTPVALKDGELTVQAESTAWATQLRLLQRQILKRMNDGLGKNVVRKIKVQGPAAPSWRHGPRHVPGRGPRDTYG